MTASQRLEWIARFVHGTGRDDEEHDPATLEKSAEQLWYSYHDQDPHAVARHWHERDLPDPIVRDAWTAACRHRLFTLDRGLDGEAADDLAHDLYRDARWRSMAPHAAAMGWWSEAR